MTTGNETLAAEQWLYTTLAAASALTAIVSTRIYADEVPQTATYPLVRFAFLSAVDRPVAGGARMLSNLLYQVEVIAQASSFAGNLATAAAALDAAIHAKNGSASAGTIVACVREEPFRAAEMGEGGLPFRRLGGRYRLLVQP